MLLSRFCAARVLHSRSSFPAQHQHHHQCQQTPSITGRAARGTTGSILFARNLKIESISEEEQVARRQKMGQKIPVSPHVTIYSFPLPAIASITTRITGVTLSAGAATLGGLCLTVGPEGVLPAIESFTVSYPALATMGKFAIGFPLVYHYVSGMRHLFWDYTLKGFKTSDMVSSSVGVIVVACGLTTALMFLSLPERKEKE